MGFITICRSKRYDNRRTETRREKYKFTVVGFYVIGDNGMLLLENRP